MREFSGPVSVVLALAIVSSLVVVDRSVSRTLERQAKQQPGTDTCEDIGHYLTRIYQRSGIEYEKPHPGHKSNGKGISTTGNTQQNCQAPSRRPGETM
jgi:hypothetical protein